MKRTAAISILVLLSLLSVAQQTSIKKDRAYFLDKSRSQRTAAWILTGAGAAMAIGGGIGFNENFSLFGPGGETEAAIMIVGTVMVAAGIALHIMATNSKQKADLVITGIPYQGPTQNKWTQKKMLALQWRIPLTKQASSRNYFAN